MGGGGWRIFESQEFFFVIKFLVWIWSEFIRVISKSDERAVLNYHFITAILKSQNWVSTSILLIKYPVCWAETQRLFASFTSSLNRKRPLHLIFIYPSDVIYQWKQSLEGCFITLSGFWVRYEPLPRQWETKTFCKSEEVAHGTHHICLSDETCIKPMLRLLNIAFIFISASLKHLSIFLAKIRSKPTFPLFYK